MGDIRKIYKDARRAALWGVMVNLAVGLVKLLGGLFGHSFALLIDSVHSLVDAVISGTLLGVLWYAERPADPEHPYGHTRVEAVVGACVALILIVLAMGLGWEAWSTRSGPHPIPRTLTLVAAASGALCQEVVSRYARRVARRTGSLALMATAWDYRTDAMGSLVVLIGVAVSKWGGPTWYWADRAAAGLVVATILWVGCKLFWTNAQELMDRQADPEMLESVRREALAVPSVRDVETLRMRKAGLEYLVDIHIQVDPELTVKKGHSIAHAVKDRVMRQVAPVRDVLVHIEPFETLIPLRMVILGAHVG